MIEWEDHVKKTDEHIPIDLWPDRVGLTSLSCTPFIALQEPNYSNIENTVRDYNVQMKTSEELIGSIPNNSVCEPFQNFIT